MIRISVLVIIPPTNFQRANSAADFYNLVGCLIYYVINFSDNWRVHFNIIPQLFKLVKYKINKLWARVLKRPRCALESVTTSSSAHDTSIRHKLILFQFTVLNFAKILQTLKPEFPFCLELRTNLCLGRIAVALCDKTRTKKWLIFVWQRS